MNHPAWKRASPAERREVARAEGVSASRKLELMAIALMVSACGMRIAGFEALALMFYGAACYFLGRSESS